MQQVVQGQIIQIEPRNNGWFAVHVATPGSQYPRKLSTKRQELVTAAQSLMGQYVDALYNEEQSSSINPHNGQPYINRYLEQLAPAGSMPPPQVAPQQQAPQAVPTTMMQPQPQSFGNLQPQQYLPPQPQPAAPPVIRHEVGTDEQRESRIMRQAATKVAAVFLPMLAEEDRNLGSLIRISEQLMKYYREGVAWDTAPVQAPVQTQLPVAAGAGYENPNEYGDPGPQPGDPGQFPEGY